MNKRWLVNMRLFHRGVIRYECIAETEEKAHELAVYYVNQLGDELVEIYSIIHAYWR